LEKAFLVPGDETEDGPAPLFGHAGCADCTWKVKVSRQGHSHLCPAIERRRLPK
jgi:hypothetical protein